MGQRILNRDDQRQGRRYETILDEPYPRVAWFEMELVVHIYGLTTDTRRAESAIHVSIGA